MSEKPKWQGITPRDWPKALQMVEDGDYAESIAYHFNCELQWVLDNVPGVVPMPDPVEPPPEPTPPPEPEPLLAVATVSPESGPVPLQVTLDGSGSTGPIEKYDWMFSTNVIATGVTATATSHVEGPVEYRLVVTDADGNTSEATVTVTGEAAAPATARKKSKRAASPGGTKDGGK
jgi:hypothetical protein